MTAVFKREFRSFFTSPVGYVVLAVLFCFSGYFFFVYNLASGSADSLTGIVVGKFLSALLMFAIGLSITIVYAVVIAVQVTPDWMVIIGNLLGLLLLGGMVISIGMLISSLTESQFIAALGTFVVSFALLMIDNLKYLFNASWLATIVDFLSINQRYNDFTIGVIHYDDILFFLSMQVLFLFLTVRVLDRKRWS